MDKKNKRIGIIKERFCKRKTNPDQYKKSNRGHIFAAITPSSLQPGSINGPVVFMQTFEPINTEILPNKGTVVTV